MSDQVPETVNQNEEKKQSDKEKNFRMLEAKHQRELAQERARASELEKQLQERNKQVVEEDDDDEPYVAPKKLEKKLAKFEEKTSKKTSEEIKLAVAIALQEERNNNWINQNSDFEEIMSEQNVAKFIQQHKDLADSISRMPEGFEREKLVYKNIKALGMHKPEVKQSSIQDKIDANKRNPYYQPSGIGTAAYSQTSDFSDSGKKKAYENMQKLKSKYGM